MAASDLAERIASDYPLLAFLVNDPEIGQLLREAVDPNAPFSTTTFRYKVAQTNWWRTKTQSAREWEILANTDPAEARRRRSTFAANLRQAAGRLGIGLSNQDVTNITRDWIGSGIDVTGPEFTHRLIEYGRKKGSIGAGGYKTAGRAVGELAESQWARGVSAKEQRDWAYWITMGQKSLEDWNAHLAAEAVHRFPHMAPQIKAGSSVADVVGPFVGLVAQELEEDPGYIWSKIKANDPAFRKLLGLRDPKSGEMRLPTESDAIRIARSRSTWWDTSNGRQADAEATRGILQIMGVRR